MLSSAPFFVQDTIRQILEYQVRVEVLFEQSPDIIPLHLRKEALPAPIKAKAICTYSQDKVRVCPSIRPSVICPSRGVDSPKICVHMLENYSQKCTRTRTPQRAKIIAFFFAKQGVNKTQLSFCLWFLWLLVKIHAISC